MTLRDLIKEEVEFVNAAGDAFEPGFVARNNPHDLDLSISFDLLHPESSIADVRFIEGGIRTGYYIDLYDFMRKRAIWGELL